MVASIGCSFLGSAFCLENHYPRSTGVLSCLFRTLLHALLRWIRVYSDKYHPQLSGHETFPIRYGWLKKAFDAVWDTEGQADNRQVFTGPDAIARFGVGKNMVASMRHWATVAGIIGEDPDRHSISTTTLGRLLFGERRLDPYMEHPATAWLLHWQLCGWDTKTTWFWAFHYWPSISFEREELVQGIQKLAEEREWTRASVGTIRRDVSCFIRTYVAQAPPGQGNYEDGLESPLTELGLIKPTGRRDSFRLVRGPKPSLSPGIFSYAVTDYWERHFPTANTLSFEALTYEPGSPGRAFLLEDNDVVDMLIRLEEVSRGLYQWSETAGLKQLIRSQPVSTTESFEWLEKDYGQPEPSRAFG